jgi:hypothetical protein
VQVNTNDPLAVAILIAIVVIVLVGFYFALREVIADAILLADKKRDQQNGPGRGNNRR